ncbi:MAG: DUF4276 family protein [Acidobacteriaceae bacterium]|nr:DUF4276 family protein [Acidobacteriaceae bacterium]
MDIWIYFEGKSTLRPGFDIFFSQLHELARQNNVTLRLFAAKDGPRDFEKAPRRHPNTLIILLKDSEQPFDDPVKLCQLRGIDPKLADKVFWMIESMESWFLADPETLANYYGNGFSHKVIGQPTNVETISKSEVFRRLKSATVNTTKGAYDKTRHAPDILAKLNSELVQKRAEHCRKLFEAVRKMLES